MKKDMQDILVDCRRYQNFFPHYDRNYKGDLEDAPTKEPISPFRSKSFADRLRPLMRYLMKQRGRPWDVVWSEICEKCDARNVRGRHLRNHVDDYVEKNVFFHEGVVMAASRFGAWRYQGLYVHPETGLLEEAKRPKPKPREKPFTELKVNNQMFKWIEGFWYEVWTEQRVEFSTGKEVPFIYKQRQLNAKELRDLGLKNYNQE